MNLFLWSMNSFTNEVIFIPVNTAFIILAQTKGGAVLEIILLLIVAGTIGYTTAWFFYKSVYEKRRKEIESDKQHLNTRIIQLNGDLADLRKSLDDKDHEIERYFREDLAKHKHLIGRKAGAA